MDLPRLAFAARGLGDDGDRQRRHQRSGITCPRSLSRYAAQSSISRCRRSNRSERASAASTLFWTTCASAAVAIDRDGSKYQAKLTARGEVFRGTGQTPVLALQAVLSVIIKSAIKPGRGRPTERLRVAATLLHLSE